MEPIGQPLQGHQTEGLEAIPRPFQMADISQQEISLKERRRQFQRQ